MLLAVAPWAAGMSVSLTGSTPSPASVGTIVTFTASAAGADAGTLWYRFGVRGFGQDLRIVKDYGPENTVNWTASNQEGIYEIVVSVRNLSTGEAESATNYFEMQSLASGTQPVITPTANAMVFLYSAPSCAAGARMRVRFQAAQGTAQFTPYQDCTPGKSMNFYLAGMRSGVPYTVIHVVDTGTNFVNGPALSLTVPAPPPNLTTANVIQPAAANAPDGILLQSTLIANAVATDLSGNVVWYYPNSDITYITRPAPGGYFFAVQENTTGDQSQQVLREFDLTGTTIRQTNAARVNEQLAAMGKRSISAFHHEARLLPDGDIVTLAGVEQILTDVQGAGPVDVLGDMILVLDQNLQVIWTWDTFDHLDTTRQATLQDQCQPLDCPPLFLAGSANDWTHGNSVQLTPDGQLLYSSRAQDWVIKIDYENGSGDGSIVWRLGNGGDFQIVSTDPSPWFTHQHDPQYQADDVTMTVFDNGNVRNLADPTQNSRGQVLRINEQTMVATLNLNADLGQFAVALGAAQKLPDNTYHFDLGYQTAGSYAITVTPDGKIVYELNASSPEYRSFRMPDLYSPPYGTH